MKLIKYGEELNEKTGVSIDGVNYDVSSFFEDYNEAFFENNGLEKLQKILSTEKLNPIDSSSRLGAPFARPSKIVCIGLNYVDHAKETNAEIPKEPVVFFKATTALNGPNDAIIIPKNSVKTDWEVELAVVIGKKASYVSVENAMEYVAGYCLHNDYSEREFQLERGGTWDKGKGCDTFAPLGPFLVTKDEVSDPNDLKLWLKVNGEMMQNGSTNKFIFKVDEVVSYVSQFMTLLPGDVISTGTPPGVGLGKNPPLYLKPGDSVELGIEGLGEQKQILKAWG